MPYILCRSWQPLLVWPVGEPSNQTIYSWDLCPWFLGGVSLYIDQSVYPQELKTFKRRCQRAPSIFNGPAGVIRVATP